MQMVGEIGKKNSRKNFKGKILRKLEKNFKEIPKGFRNIPNFKLEKSWEQL